MARVYLAVQAASGALWWVVLFQSDDVQRWTIGDWDRGVLVGPDLLLFVGASAVASAMSSRAIAAIAAVWTSAITIALAIYGLTERAAGWGVLLMATAAVGTLAAAATLWFGRLPVHWFFVGPFAFHVAAERTAGRNLRRSLTQLVVFWGAFFIVVPLLAEAVERRLRLDWPALRSGGWGWIGALVFVAASALGLWACLAMAVRGEGTPLPSETARRLVAVGPYQRVRNPMAVAGALQTVGAGLVTGSWTVVALAVMGAVGWNQLIRPHEEADLASRFGDDYERYRSRVRCWIPARA